MWFKKYTGFGYEYFRAPLLEKFIISQRTDGTWLVDEFLFQKEESAVLFTEAIILLSQGGNGETVVYTAKDGTQFTSFAPITDLNKLQEVIRRDHGEEVP